MIRNVSFSIAFLVVSVAANAQQRVFVSALTGNDANPCSVTSPCRSFAQAMTLVSVGGEILALDSGGFGPVTITHSVSIVSPLGVEGSITQSTAGAAAVTINASGGVVVLRGLGIFGLGTGQDGIAITQAAFVAVQSCNISRFTFSGIDMNVTTPTLLSVSDTTSNNNGGNGIFTTSNANDFAELQIDHCHLQYNTFAGFNGYPGTRGTIRDSVLAGGQYGIAVQTLAAGQTSVLDIENCTVTWNSTAGIAAAGDGQTGVEYVRVSNSLIAHTGHAVTNFADINAHIETRGNNTVIDNAIDGTFTASFAAQ